jgi:hypothetical protein
VKETNPKEHDQVIAYTSQMAHVVSNAYIKSDTCKIRYGFSAGSFKDLTRVAYLNETMWTELFLENREPLLEELKELKKSDVLVKFSRNKTYDLVSRTTALANLINIGVAPGHAFPVVDVFDDNQQVVIDSLEMINKILESKMQKPAANNVAAGNGVTVDGVKGANDYNAEQNRENDPAE